MTTLIILLRTLVLCISFSKFKVLSSTFFSKFLLRSSILWKAPENLEVNMYACEKINITKPKEE